MTPEIIQALDQPLHVSAIKQRKNYGGGGSLSYIEAHHAIREANRIFGYGGWSRETVQIERIASTPYKNRKTDADMMAVHYMARVRITVGNVVREGCGYGDGQAAVSQAGSAHELAIKEAESDAMKRALMTFGDPFGLALYEKDKSKANVSTGPVKSSASKNDASRAVYKDLQQNIDAAGTDADALTIWANDPETSRIINTLPADWQGEIRKRYKDALIAAKAHKMENAA